MAGQVDVEVLRERNRKSENYYLDPTIPVDPTIVAEHNRAWTDHLGDRIWGEMSHGEAIHFENSSQIAK